MKTKEPKKQNKLVGVLGDLGLDKKQAKLYLTCLEFESSTVQNLAVKSGLKRTTIYFLLEELEKMGLVNVIKQNKKTYVVAKNPKVLLKDIDKKREKLVKAMPFFEKINKSGNINPKFVFYRGTEGFKNFWKELLDSGEKEWLLLSSGKDFLSFVSEGYIVNRIIKEKREKNIKSRQIINNSQYAQEIVRKDKEENRESRIVSARYPLPAIEIIYGNKTAIISSSFENLLIVIDSPEVAQTHRSYFEMIWQFAGDNPIAPIR